MTDDEKAAAYYKAGLGGNVVPIRPTVGMDRLEQLRAFVAWEKEDNPRKTHIAAWALFEIERLRELVKELHHFVPHNHDGIDCAGCAMDARIAEVITPNVQDNSAAASRQSGVAKRSESSSPG